MKFSKEELTVIKNSIMTKLEPHIGMVDDASAKNIAYLSPENFEDIEVQELKWTQIVLRKVIIKLMELNET